jgi:hypothetical protein
MKNSSKLKTGQTGARLGQQLLSPQLLWALIGRIRQMELRTRHCSQHCVLLTTPSNPLPSPLS